jgi:hypothetical protein
MKNGIFGDVTPRGSCKNRSFGGIEPFHHQGNISMMEALVSSETSVITITTQRNIPEDGILHIKIVFISKTIFQ